MEEITFAEIDTGKPVKSTTSHKYKKNFEEIDERVSSLEGGGNSVYPPIIMRVNGAYGEPGDFDVVLDGEGVLKTTPNFNLVITGVFLIIDKAGVSGKTEIDLKYKRGSAEFASVLSTKPSVNASAGNDATSNNAVVNESRNTLLAGDILRLDITSVQHRAKGLMVRIDYFKL